MYQQDLVGFILAAQQGAIAPYKYANHFARNLPSHLHPSSAEKDAIAANGVGYFRSREARKFNSKVFQLFREQRSIAAHLFYTPCHKFWHLFYFDNRDTDEAENHWKHGAHVHYVSDLWPELTMESAWSQVLRGELRFASKLHIRYRSRYSGAYPTLKQSANGRPPGPLWRYTVHVHEPGSGFQPSWSA